jgi:hypothetical protein
MKILLTRDIPPRAAIAVIALALLATVVSGREKPDLAEEAEATPARAAARAAAPEAAPELDPTRLKRARTDQAIADLFASSAPAAGAEAGQSTPRPSAPPLPFQYVAKIIDGSSTNVYVMHGEDHYSVKPGLVIDRNYKVEKVTETAVTFTFLPLGTRQVLSLN